MSTIVYRPVHTDPCARCGCCFPLFAFGLCGACIYDEERRIAAIEEPQDADAADPTPCHVCESAPATTDALDWSDDAGDVVPVGVCAECFADSQTDPA